jgi:hypothetical protein
MGLAAGRLGKFAIGGLKATMPSTSPLRQLADIISASVDNIDAQLLQAKVGYPSLDDPFNPMSPSEAATANPEVVQSSFLVVAACAQLSAIVKMPALTLYDAVGGVSESIVAPSVLGRMRHQPCYVSDTLANYAVPCSLLP